MLDAIKNCYHITTATLADFLGISTAMLSSIACDRRAWRFDSLHSVSRLYQALDMGKALTELDQFNALMEQEESKIKRGIPAVILTLQVTLNRRKETLTQLKVSRKAWARGILACRSLLKTDLNNKERSWIQMREKSLEAKLKENNRLKVRLLEAEVIGLQARIETLRNGME